MTKINSNFRLLGQNYLFSEVAARVARFQKANPEANIIKMGIGDVSLPLVPAVVDAMHKAVDECSTQATFRGYGPEHGYEFLRNKIVENDFKGLGIEASEVFINDGAKSDTGNIGDLFSVDNVIGVTDPVYPVYVDTNMMSGRKIEYIVCNESNLYMGDIPEKKLDVIYLCYPNNPTGAVISREKLTEWVEYALKNDTVILYDAAYEAYIRDPEIPHSIYEIEGAKKCAIEFRSFSKTAGFTGVRCGYTIVPKELVIDGLSVNHLWERRQSCKFNGASYISQRGAEAIYSPEGKQQVNEAIDYYLNNASVIREALSSIGLAPIGGQNSPYIWAHTPDSMKSWDFFDFLLEKAQVVITPGAGFGKAGENFFRVTAYSSYEKTQEAMERIKELF